MTDAKAAAPRTGAPTYKRSVRNIFVHKPMQREFSFVLIALLLLSIFAVSWVIHQTIHEAAYGGGFRFGKVSAYEILSDISYQLLVRVCSILFVTLGIIAIFGVFFLHRVAGPVYRFRSTFLRLNEGHIPHMIQLREGDFFQETADEINRLIKKTQFETAKRKQIAEKLDFMIQSGDSRAKEVKDLFDQVWVEKANPGKG